jgi:hypothetical protein
MNNINNFPSGNLRATPHRKWVNPNVPATDGTPPLMAYKTVSIPCYVCKDQKVKIGNTAGIFIDSEFYFPTIKKFDVADIEILDYELPGSEMSYGGILSSVTVRAVSEKGSINPFYVDENKIEQLQRVIEDSRDCSNIRL